MVGPLGVAAALVGAAIVFDTDEDHDGVVQKTADNLEPKLPEHATLYADHLDGDYPNPRGAFNDVQNAPEDHIPDVVVTSGVKNNLIIEVETGDAIDGNSADAKSQIEDFSIPGSLGLRLLGLWLLLHAFIDLFSLSFQYQSLVLTVLALVTGVLLIVGS